MRAAFAIVELCCVPSPLSSLLRAGFQLSLEVYEIPGVYLNEEQNRPRAGAGVKTPSDSSTGTSWFRLHRAASGGHRLLLARSLLPLWSGPCLKDARVTRWWMCSAQ